MSSDPSVYTFRFQGTGVFNADTLAALNKALDEIEENPDVQVLLLTGEDKNFSQGLDLEYLMANQHLFKDFVVSSMHMVGRLLSFPIPVVSLINGHAFGLGAMIVLGSDYAVMRRDRGFWCLPEIDIGMTLSTRMNALVNAKMSPKAVRDALLTGARIGAEQAATLGIVDAAAEQADLVTEGLVLAAPMRGKPRHLLAGIKHGVNRDLLELFYSDVDDGPYQPFVRPA